ncbi:MAG: hypothetical protein JF626_12230, partial [Polaromonas sp.]|nr:hypothetical protein [Polaromonas sp.]
MKSTRHEGKPGFFGYLLRALPLAFAALAGPAQAQAPAPAQQLVLGISEGTSGGL